MTLADKMQEVENSYNNWVGNYIRKDLRTNNARIVGEALCKALILRNWGESDGTKIIFGAVSGVPKKRYSKFGQQLAFADLVEVLQERGIFNQDRHIYMQLELLRNRTNPSSHSTNKPSDETTIDDMEVCNASLSQILKWFYSSLGHPIPDQISNGFSGKIDFDLLTFEQERWREFEMVCQNFDKRRHQYILIAPKHISEQQHVVSALTRLPWRLVVDFNPKSDEEQNGLLYCFNQQKGEGYKKVFTIDDRIDFDPNFPHYWFFANGHVTEFANTYKDWRSGYKRFYSDILYTQFIKGSRPKARIAVLLDIPPLYAEHIIEEFNRCDEKNLQFVLCSTEQKYEGVFEKFENVTLVEVSAHNIANGIHSTYRLTEDSQSSTILIPTLSDGSKSFVEITRDHYDYLASLGIEIVYKGVEHVQSTSKDADSFYKGSLISWRDLSEQKDVIRTSLELLKKRIEAKLSENKLAEVTLVHEAGAGGTTLSRRIAFDFSLHYPTIVLRSYLNRKTIDALRIIYDQYTKGSLPVLIIAEAFEIRDIHLLYRDLSNTKKNAVILIVHRSSIYKAPDKKFVLKAQLEGTEIGAFENTYAQLVPTLAKKIKEIPTEYKFQHRYITPVLYALTTFGKDYQGLHEYITKCLDGITLEQKKLTGFLCMIYYYTQLSVPAEIFSALFGVTRDKSNLLEILGNDNPVLELLHEEGDDEQYFNVWRPRYALVGEDAMKIVLSGGINTENWKSSLRVWYIDMIKYIKSSVPFLDGETLELLNSFFIERPFPDFGSENSEFTRAIHDLPNAIDGLTVFESLTTAYPNEAHFHGHFARFLYSDKVGIRDYDRAINEAELSLAIFPNNSSLIHTLGMCYREKTENLIHTYESQGLSTEDAEVEVQNLTELACDTFDKCVEVEPLNIYGYESQIRVILKSLDFGFKVYQASSKETFITNPSNHWYASKLDKVSKLLDEALFVIEQELKVENRERVQKSAAFIHNCEGLFLRTLGKHQAAKSKFEELVKKTPSGYEFMRPHFRRMFVMCLLASKSSGRDIYLAWGNISESEIAQSVSFLEDNIFEDPTNTQNIRLWLYAVRHLKTPPSIENCISRLAAWTQATRQSENSLLEGYYYLYVLNAVKALGNLHSFDPTPVEVVKEILAKMKPLVRNEKFCFEWFGYGQGIVQMVNHRVLGELTADFFERNRTRLMEVTGRIKEISSSQQGFIVLDCGLRAFFVPGVGGFTERNLHDRVKCYVGFRYDQIQAWSVVLATSIREEDSSLRSMEGRSLNELIEDTPTATLDAIPAPIAERVEMPKLPGPKVVGAMNVRVPDKKVDQLTFPPETNAVYTGHITALKDSAGFIRVTGLDRDVTFKAKHLANVKFEDLHKGREVRVQVDFFENGPKTDFSGRNYIAKSVRVK